MGLLPFLHMLVLKGSWPGHSTVGVKRAWGCSHHDRLGVLWSLRAFLWWSHSLQEASLSFSHIMGSGSAGSLSHSMVSL